MFEYDIRIICDNVYLNLQLPFMYQVETAINYVDSIIPAPGLADILFIFNIDGSAKY